MPAVSLLWASVEVREAAPCALPAAPGLGSAAFAVCVCGFVRGFVSLDPLGLPRPRLCISHDSQSAGFMLSSAHRHHVGSHTTPGHPSADTQY
jgi:hypothetical protein